MSDPLPLQIRELRKSFGDRSALDGVTLELRPRELLGLLGPNGAGKSTLVRSVVGRVRPDAGEIRILGHAPLDPVSHRLVGYVPQEIALYGLLSPAENLWSFGRYQGLEGEELEAGIQRSLEWTGLSDRSRERTDRLSGGMKRRLNIAAGTIHRPKLLLLDEPTVGVDPQSRERIYGMIEELRQGGVSLLYTTHYMEEAERLCDRIAIIDHGRIIALGTKEELLRSTLGDRQTLTIDSASAVHAAVRQRLESRGATITDERIQLSVGEPAREIPEWLETLRGEGVAVRDLTLKRGNLENVFLHLTGRELRE